MSQRHIWCSSARLSNGWAESVLLELDSDGIIAAITTDCDSRQRAEADELINGAVIPGMPNLHSHAHQRAMAGRAEHTDGNADSFWSWRRVMYRMLEQINPQQMYDIARMLYLEMLQAGYTHVAEFQYLHHQPGGGAYDNPAEMTLQCLQAARDVGIGFTALPVLYRFGGFGSVPASEGQQRFINDVDRFSVLWHKINDALQPIECIGVAPHSLRAINQPLLDDVLQQLPDDIVVHLHIAEQIKEVDDCVAWSGQRPLEWLMQRFEVDQRWCLIHATHLDQAEKSSLVASGAIAGLCPTTEANLGDGLFDLPAFDAVAGAWGIGSDSQVSVSVTEELRWLEYGQRLIHQQRNVMARADRQDGHCGARLFDSALQGGSQACDLPRIGLVTGAPANFVVLDPHHPRLAGTSTNTLLDSWIFSAGDAAIFAVYTHGQKRIDQGRHIDQAAIVAAFDATLQQLNR